jgi:hypothetical protein
MDSSPTPQAGERRRHIARFHAVARERRMDEAERRAFLKRRTGKTSCKELTDEELVDLVAWLKPTARQWSELSRLCRAMDFGGFEDPRFRAFVTHTTKVADPAHLTRLAAQDLILGMRKWVKHRQRGAAAPNDPNDPAPPPDSPPGNENAPTRDRRGVDLGGPCGVTCKPSVDPCQGIHD